MKTKSKLAILIIIIGIIMLIFPKCVNAKTVKLSYQTPVIMFQNSTLDMTLEDFIGSPRLGYYAYQLHGTHIFANKFIFCVKPDQSLLGGEYYYSNEKYILKEGAVEKTTKLDYKKDFNNYTPVIKNGGDCYNFAKGLAYIISFYNDSNYSHDRSGDGVNKSPIHDEVNLALWAYLDTVRQKSTEARDFFGIEIQNVTINHTKKIVSKSSYGDYEESAKSYKLYAEAMDIFNGKKTCKITGEFYKLTDCDYPGSSQELVFPIEIEITDEPEVPQIKLDLYKVDYYNTGKGISGSKIKIEKVSNVASISKTELQSAGTTGKYGTIAINPTAANPGTIKIKVTETQEPYGYDKLSNSVELTIEYDKKTGEVKKITPNKNTDYFKIEIPTTGSSVGIGKISIKNKSRKTELNILKTDMSGANKLKDTTFTVYLNNAKTVKIGSETIKISDITKGSKKTIANGIVLERPNVDDNDRIFIRGLKTDKNGAIKIPEIISTSDVIYVTITEEKSIPGYDNLPQSLKLRFKYIDGTWKLEERTGESDSNNNNKLNSKYWELKSDSAVTVQLKNEEIIEKLTILKNDSLTGKNLDGAEFSIKVSNVKEIANSEAKNGIITLTKTVDNGKIELTDIVIDDLSKEIQIDVVETKAPANYKKLDGTITITLKREGDTYKTCKVTTTGNILEEEVKAGDLPVNNHEIQLVINNMELIELSGQVWIDGQKGEKNVKPADGKKNDDRYLEGINVRLYSIKDAKIVAETKTDKDGKYLFKDIIKTAEGYKVQFEYNGILYDDVGIKQDSKAAEVAAERTTLNNRFKTIDVNGSNDKTVINYEAYNSAEKTSKFMATVTGSEPANTAINAYTNIYKETTKDIDCGVLEKSFDLAVGTDVKEAKIKINGYEKIYTYAQIINGALDDKTLDEILQKKPANNGEPVYNLALYRSDYNYRITDYKTDIDGNKAPDADGNGIADYDSLSNLQAFVKYSVVLKNQTTHIATVDEFAYYYNQSVYIPFNEAENRELKNGDRINGYEVVSIDNGKILFISIDQEANKLKGPDYRKEIDLIFTVKQDADGRVVLKDDIRNVVEITKYSSDEGGLIDKDSQPGNADITLDGNTGNYKIGKDEDDTHLAAGINIKLRPEGDRREVTGIVFDDTKSVNGKLEDDNKAVNDVVVQLIEIKNIAGKPCEYIWQETRSGNEKLRIASKENGNPYEYPEANKGIEQGNYRFADFIPGNYIVRFIYGDGRTWDVTSNVQNYNGQDYQSTIDENNYNKQWYDAAAYQTNSSVATDNEARRLETMAYTVEVNGELGTAIKTINTDFAKLTQEEKKLMTDYYSQILELANKNEKDKEILEKAYKTAYKTETVALPEANDASKVEDYYKIVKNYALQKTWMSAETAKIYVPIDAEKFNSVNFGLRLRPETKITVEKHITALKITPTGVGAGAIVDARVNIDDVLNNRIDKNTKQGDASNLAIIPSTRTERGFWKVETDVEELAQGAKLEVEYTYVIRNESEDYYLSRYLLEKYEENKDNLEEYKNILMNKAVEAKNAGAEGKGSFLGKYYYTGKLSANEDKNLARVDKLEEALNNKLYYNETQENAAFKKENTDPVAKKYYNVEGRIKELEIETIVATNTATKCLKIGEEEKDRKLNLETTISVLTNGEIGATIPSYITEIETYSNAAGRINKNSAVPGNLAYIHNEDKRATLESYVQKDENGDYAEKISTTEQAGYIKINECDEFWGETIIISKPTGQDKNTTVIITIVLISSIAVIGAGIILIKKYALKK